MMVALWTGQYTEIHSLHRPTSDKSSRNGGLASWVGKEDRPVGGARVPWRDIVAKRPTPPFLSSSEDVGEAEADPPLLTPRGRWTPSRNCGHCAGRLPPGVSEKSEPLL